MASRLLCLRNLARQLKPYFPSSSSPSILSRGLLLKVWRTPQIYPNAFSPRGFCSRSSDLGSYSHGPAAIDYCSLLQEDEFHKLANSTIHHLQEKLEEYGDSIDIDGFDVDYGSDVLTLKLGDLGTYVLNKQTPNRQLWLSSPISGPSRFDWDQSAQTWVYRRTKANLLKVLETEVKQLCGEPIKLA